MLDVLNSKFYDFCYHKDLSKIYLGDKLYEQDAYEYLRYLGRPHVDILKKRGIVISLKLLLTSSLGEYFC